MTGIYNLVVVGRLLSTDDSNNLVNSREDLVNLREVNIGNIGEGLLAVNRSVSSVPFQNQNITLTRRPFSFTNILRRLGSRERPFYRLTTLEFTRLVSNPNNVAPSAVVRVVSSLIATPLRFLGTNPYVTGAIALVTILTTSREVFSAVKKKFFSTPITLGPDLVYRENDLFVTSVLGIKLTFQSRGYGSQIFDSEFSFSLPNCIVACVINNTSLTYLNDWFILIPKETQLNLYQLAQMKICESLSGELVVEFVPNEILSNENLNESPVSLGNAVNSPFAESTVVLCKKRWGTDTNLEPYNICVDFHSGTVSNGEDQIIVPEKSQYIHFYVKKAEPDQP